MRTIGIHSTSPVILAISTWSTGAARDIPGTMRDDSGKSRVTVFRDADVPIADSCPSAPEILAGWLREAGYGVNFLKTRKLADPVQIFRKFSMC